VVETTLLEDAVEFMLSAYDRSGTPGGAEHSLEVATLLAETGARRDVIAAAVLHDVVEDTAASLDDLRARFGPDIAEIVGVLTENAEIGDAPQRNHALREAVAAGSPAAGEIFAADKLARLRAAERDREVLEPQSLDHFRRSCEMLAAHGLGPRFLEELGARLRGQRDAAVIEPENPQRAKLLRDARSVTTESGAVVEETSAVLA
jgi:(p)ppGpp synthase/HD superfamily hydrolase